MVVALGLSWWFWGRLPDPMPIHWNFQGHPDRFVSKLYALLGLPLLALGVPLLITAFLQIDKRWQAGEGSRRAVEGIITYLGFFLMALHAIGIKAALEPSSKLSLPLLFLVMGIFFALLGNGMPSLKPNGLAGIRIPATLNDQRIWEKTHRFGGWTMTVAGLLVAVSGFLLPEQAAAIAVIALIFTSVLLPIGYALHLRRILPPPSP